MASGYPPGLRRRQAGGQQWSGSGWVVPRLQALTRGATGPLAPLRARAYVYGRRRATGPGLAFVAPRTHTGVWTTEDAP